MSPSMLALVVRQDNNLELIETAVPEPGPGQVRIRVAASAVNPVDLGTASGAIAGSGMVVPRDQRGLGWDVSGRIDAVGSGVSLAVETAVIGLSDQLWPALKSHAQYVVLDASSVAPAPTSVGLIEASTIGLNGLTALQALDAAETIFGETLLVTGAAGAVGGYAMQLAKHRGLTVVASAGEHDEQLVRSLGADEFIPRSAELATRLRELIPGGVDVALDAAGVGVEALDAVRNRGRLVHVTAGPLEPLRGIAVHRVRVAADSRELSELSRLVDAGVLTVRVAATYPLRDASEAYRRLGAGGIRGRLVLTM
jgi:NADPH2:quinone reductase